MFNTQNLLTVAALAGASLAQSSTSLDCSQSVSSLIANAPTMAAELTPYLEDPFNNPVQTLSDGAVTTLPPDTLANPSGYVEVLCSVAAELPSSLLPDFQSYGQALLKYGSSHISEYDAFVTECVTTGPVASSTISYLNNLLTGTGLLCQPTETPSSNGTVSTAPFPTATGGANSTASSTLATSVPTAAAAKPTGVLVGAAAMGGLLGAAVML